MLLYCAVVLCCCTVPLYCAVVLCCFTVLLYCAVVLCCCTVPLYFAVLLCCCTVLLYCAVVLLFCTVLGLKLHNHYLKVFCLRPFKIVERKVKEKRRRKKTDVVKHKQLSMETC